MMHLEEVIFISISLAMDAFAVAVCKGLSFKKNDLNKSLVVAIYFGIFQALMPLIGYYLGYSFEEVVVKVNHIIAFILLTIIGLGMINESRIKKEFDNKVTFLSMLPLAIATSIDALAVGVTYAFLNVDIIVPIILIELITFIISFIGAKLGSKIGNKYGSVAELIGGIVLIFIGIKILLEYFHIIS